MTKPENTIIKDDKRRGEWAETVFMARAAEHGLPVSKPMGESDSFDCVVGYPGKFVAVQVKCTMAKPEAGKGYKCSLMMSHNQKYREGAFDFVAAYVIPEDAWYIVPAKLILGQATMRLGGPLGRFEQYREAWHLLREAVAREEIKEQPEPEPLVESPVMRRMRASFGFMRRRLVGEE
jgi:hypothetical protein